MQRRGFEEQMGKLVTENRELEWAKERLQHQRETVAKQHAESVDSVEKKFQAKMKSIEEEKGKCEASVEIKDKEINSLKAELKSAQVLRSLFCVLLSFLGLEGDAPVRPDTVRDKPLSPR
uniref:Uncharacterized protein n=1 Tax=Takifugu rubripes TaxID=31033 RepID=A0A674NSM8_TAKRU